MKKMWAVGIVLALALGVIALLRFSPALLTDNGLLDGLVRMKAGKDWTLQGAALTKFDGVYPADWPAELRFPPALETDVYRVPWAHNTNGIDMEGVVKCASPQQLVDTFEAQLAPVASEVERRNEAGEHFYRCRFETARYKDVRINVFFAKNAVFTVPRAENEAEYVHFQIFVFNGMG